MLDRWSLTEAEQEDEDEEEESLRRGCGSGGQTRVVSDGEG